MDSKQKNWKIPANKIQEHKNPHTRANPTKAHTCPQHVLRALAPRKPKLERENPRKQNLRTQKSSNTRATPPRRTRASHVLRALAPTKPNLERENPRKQNLRMQKSPHTRANPTKAHTCPRHVLRALAPRKPNLERENPRKQNLRMQKSPHTRATPPRRTRAPRHVLRALAPRKPNLERGKWTASKRTGKSTQTKSQNAKISPHTRNPTKAHTCFAHAACACSNQAELRTGKWTASKRTGKSTQTKSQNAKIPTHTRKPHQGAHVPTARAACACSEKAELRTGKSTQTKSQNAKIPTHTRNPTKAHTCPRHVLRALAPTKPNSERENGQQAPFSVNCSTISKKWSKRCQHPWKTIFRLAAANRTSQ